MTEKGLRIAGLWSTYSDYLNSDEWKDKRETKLSEANYCCEQCGRKRGTIKTKLLCSLNAPTWSECLHCESYCQNRHVVKEQVILEIHHLTYDRVGNEKSSDLQVLCSKCHKLKHLRGNKNGKNV